MKKTTIICICMMTLAVLIPLTATDVSADEVGPEITDIFHVPNYPLYGENVTVYASVTDPDGIQFVRIQYCVSSCSLVIMDGPDGNNMYWGTNSMGPCMGKRNSGLLRHIRKGHKLE